jgi:DNA-binding response OmpR family regulator
MKGKMASPFLRSRRILVVEDEYLIAIWLRDHLRGARFDCPWASALSRKGPQLN